MEMGPPSPKPLLPTHHLLDHEFIILSAGGDQHGISQDFCQVSIPHLEDQIDIRTEGPKITTFTVSKKCPEEVVLQNI